MNKNNSYILSIGIKRLSHYTIDITNALTASGYFFDLIIYIYLYLLIQNKYF